MTLLIIHKKEMNKDCGDCGTQSRKSILAPLTPLIGILRTEQAQQKKGLQKSWSLSIIVKVAVCHFLILTDRWS